VLTLLAAWPAIRPGVRGGWTLLLFAIIAVSLLGCYIAWRVSRGTWSDADVSRQRDRPHFYIVAVTVSFGILMALWLLGASQPVLRGAAGVPALLFLAFLATFWRKVSLHVAFAAFATAIMTSVNLWFLPAGALACLALGWSRLVLHRHTAVEVAAGAVLGAVCGIAVVGL
jgi:membrane-associated phospholipid phosphatase